mmetsp:Transcript_4425/g.12969  ORF Transcript_4425/g.12969 Transcript_4425/m.12969 type:complete len:221 (+) Transcript_4425:1066-1728(+)
MVPVSTPTSVVFPAPFGPMTPRHSPRRATRSMPRSTCAPPSVTPTPRATMTCSGGGGSSAAASRSASTPELCVGAMKKSPCPPPPPPPCSRSSSSRPRMRSSPEPRTPPPRRPPLPPIALNGEGPRMHAMAASASLRMRCSHTPSSSKAAIIDPVGTHTSHPAMAQELTLTSRRARPRARSRRMAATGGTRRSASSNDTRDCSRMSSESFMGPTKKKKTA